MYLQLNGAKAQETLCNTPYSLDGNDYELIGAASRARSFIIRDAGIINNPATYGSQVPSLSRRHDMLRGTVAHRSVSQSNQPFREERFDHVGVQNPL
jgi:hypothetical protein